jgi:hypothetical protein
MGNQYEEANIRIVTHPLGVEGMKFVTSVTQEVGARWSLHEIGIQAANGAAEAGFRDVTLLVELIQHIPANSSGTRTQSRDISGHATALDALEAFGDLTNAMMNDSGGKNIVRASIWE